MNIMKPILIWVHKFEVSGDWEEQVTELCHEFTRRLALIDSPPLPIMMKIEAIRLTAIAKIQHLFMNVHIPQCTLSTLKNEMIKLVRKCLCPNSYITQDIISSVSASQTLNGFILPPE